MKFSTHLLLYNQDQWILKNIEMIGDYVDHIIVAYSKVPWDAYNPYSRSKFKNESNLDILNKSNYKNKIEIIESEWSTDEAERNSCLSRARELKSDFLFSIDCDEFFLKKDIEGLIMDIEGNPNYQYYTTPWISFWKDYQHIIYSSNNNIVGYPEICLNLKYNNSFVRCRRPSSFGDNPSLQLNRLMYHMSFVLTDEQCYSKLNTWGHSHQVLADWYKNIWLNWNENTKNLHPVDKTAWSHAIKLPDNFELPEVLR